MPEAGKIQAAGRLAGALAVIIAAVTIFLSILLHDTFSIVGHSLSDLGKPGAPSAILFNNGLIITALLGAFFSIIHYRDGSHHLEHVGSLTFLLTTISLGFIGVFPVGTDLHLPASIAFFLLLTYTLFLHGTGTIIAGKKRNGLISIWLGIIHATIWTAWSFALQDHLGIAVPEAIGTAIIAAWTLWQNKLLFPQE